MLGVLFPIGWLLLAGSVGHWRRGIGLYIGVGFVFATLFGVTGLVSGSPPAMVAGLVLYLLVLWPNFLLGMVTGLLGLFGRTFG